MMKYRNFRKKRTIVNYAMAQEKGNLMAVFVQSVKAKDNMWSRYWLAKAEEHWLNGRETLSWAVLFLNFMDEKDISL